MNPYTFYKSNVRNEDELIIGSSDIPVIIKTKNTHIKKSLYELWEEKTGKVETFQGNDFTTWGHELEPLLISAFIRKNHGAKVAYQFKVDYILHEEWRDPAKYHPPTIFHPFTECSHPRFPWAKAHADCIKNDHESPYNIEAKTGGYFARIKREGFEGFDLEDHTELGVPSDILLQTQWQMLCYDIDLTYVLLLVDDNKFHIYEIPSFRKWWPLMLEKASRFLQYCQQDKPPQPEKFDDIKKLFPEVKDKAVYVTGERAVISENMKAEKKKLESKIKLYSKRIDDIKDAAGLLMEESKYLYNGETGKKLFQQVISKDQFNLIHPSTIEKQAPEAYKILVKKGLINKHDKRYIL
jgi:hypothetical protein